MPPRPAARRSRGLDNTTPIIDIPAKISANNSETPAPASVIPLHAGNGMALQGKRDPHPATPVMPAPRRTSAAVQAERKEKEEAKASKIEARDKAIAQMAELEDQMRAEDLNTEESANHPPSTIQKKKIRKKGFTMSYQNL